MSKIKAVIFDLDGTLADTIPELTRAMNVSRARLNLPPIGRSEMLNGINNGPRELCRRTLPENAGDALINAMTKFYIEDYEDYFMYTKTPFDGMYELLAALKSRGCKIAVLTNKADNAARLMIENIFGKNYFDSVMGFADIPLKPSPDTALALAKKYGCTPDEVCFVGDSHIDMQTGVNAKMHPVGVAWGYKSREVLLENGAEYIAETPADILKFIDTQF